MDDLLVRIILACTAMHDHREIVALNLEKLNGCKKPVALPRGGVPL
jgi:hypothetical protein